jgi:hypothetical protein
VFGLCCAGLVTGSHTFPQFLTGATVSTTQSAAGLLYDIVVQYKQLTGNASMALYWSTSAFSTVNSAMLVPNAALFNSALNITGSPFLVSASTHVSSHSSFVSRG